MPSPILLHFLYATDLPAILGFLFSDLNPSLVVSGSDPSSGFFLWDPQLLFLRSAASCSHYVARSSHAVQGPQKCLCFLSCFSSFETSILKTWPNLSGFLVFSWRAEFRALFLMLLHLLLYLSLQLRCLHFPISLLLCTLLQDTTCPG